MHQAVSPDVLPDKRQGAVVDAPQGVRQSVQELAASIGLRPVRADDPRVQPVIRIDGVLYG